MTNSVYLVGYLDVDKDTSMEKVQEILEEYCQKIGVDNADVKVWNKDDISGV